MSRKQDDTSQPSVEAAPGCGCSLNAGVLMQRDRNCRREHGGEAAPAVTSVKFPPCSCGVLKICPVDCPFRKEASAPAVPLAPTPPETLRLARRRLLCPHNIRANGDTWHCADCGLNGDVGQSAVQLAIAAYDVLVGNAAVAAYLSSPSPGAVETPEGIALKRLMLAYDTEDDFEQLRWQAVARRLLGFKLTEDDADGAEALRANGYNIDADVAQLRSGGSR